MNVATPGQLVYSVTVPCVPESMAVLEDLCEAFIEAGEGLDGHAALILRLSVAEACRNALAQKDPESTFNLVTLRFLRGDAAGPRGLVLEISDPGIGLPIQGKRPPYAAGWVGQTVQVGEVLGQPILAHVEGLGSCSLALGAEGETLKLLALPPRASRSCSLALGAEGETPRPARRELILEALEEKGYGLLALCQCWRVVHFHHESGKGTTLRLEEPRLLLDQVKE